MRLPAALTSIHKWVGVVVGIQVVLWVAGGLVMSAFPIELVRGETQAARQPPAVIAANEIGVELRELMAAHGPATGLRTLRIAGDLYFELQRGEQPPLLVRATDGYAAGLVDEATARAVAARDFTGDGRISGATFLTESPGEYRGALPAWQLRFDDARDTTIYVSAQNGQVVARRTDIWRLYDFFWMLHIMDYKERVDFNHALLIGASALALALATTGFWLLFYRVRIRRRS